SRRTGSVDIARRALGIMLPWLHEPWGAEVRDVLWSQPLLLADDPAGWPRLAPAGVRAAVSGEEGAVFPAAVAMFREEVGVDPLAGDGGQIGRASCRERGWSKRGGGK